jgi:hypothetical protein
MVVKLNPAGTQALYVTYIGAEDLDIINAIAVDPHGAAYVTGPTNSRTFPLTPDAASSGRSGFSDVFVVKLNPNGTLGYGTYFGGVGNENSTEIKVDAQGSAFVTGYTSDPLPVTENAAQKTYGGQERCLCFQAQSRRHAVYLHHALRWQRRRRAQPERG